MIPSFLVASQTLFSTLLCLVRQSALGRLLVPPIFFCFTRMEATEKVLVDLLWRRNVLVFLSSSVAGCGPVSELWRQFS